MRSSHAVTGRGLTRSIVAALWLLANGTAAGQTQTVAIVAKGYSFGLEQATLSTGDVILFTTYDGSSAEPLGCSVDLCVANGEFSPVQIQGGAYHADYLAADAQGIYEYGTLQLSIPVTDSDNNGMPDVLDFERSGTFGFSGTAQCHWGPFFGCYPYSLSATISRAPGTLDGTYSGVYQNPTLGVSASFTGTMGLVGAIGTGQYQFGGDTLDIAVTSMQLPYNYQGSTTFSRIGTSQILLPSMTLTDLPSGRSITSLPVTLTRTGNTYRGHLILQDGGPDTSWADYTDLLLEITDDNDSNADGIPDLSNVDPCVDLGGDTDADTICDDQDPCKFFSNTLPLVISGFSGIPDECLCGDFDGDGFHSATDAAAINDCSAFLSLDCVKPRDEIAEPCDAETGECENDGFYSATDADKVNRVSAFLDPAYTLTCELRPEGTCGGDTGVSCF